MSEPSAPASLSGDIVDMLVREMPGVAYAGSLMAIITALRDEEDESRINLVVRPIDFEEDLVEIGVSVRIESFARKRQEPAAITAA